MKIFRTLILGMVSIPLGFIIIQAIAGIGSLLVDQVQTATIILLTGYCVLRELGE